MATTASHHATRYVLFTYLVFWCSVALVGAAFFASGQRIAVYEWTSAVASWTPTFVLLVMFRKLVPGLTRNILTFITGNLAMAVIIGVCYHHCRNLAVPMWIHFVSNLSLMPYIGDPIAPRFWLAFFYVLAAVGFSLWHVATRKKAQNERLALGA